MIEAGCELRPAGFQGVACWGHQAAFPRTWGWPRGAASRPLTWGILQESQVMRKPASQGGDRPGPAVACQPRWARKSVLGPGTAWSTMASLSFWGHRTSKALDNFHLFRFGDVWTNCSLVASKMFLFLCKGKPQSKSFNHFPPQSNMRNVVQRNSLPSPNRQHNCQKTLRWNRIFVVLFLPHPVPSQ